MVGLRVREVLEAPCLAKARVLAGASGLDRIVARLNVMEVPDILPWVKPHELLLTTGYPLRDDPAALVALVGELDDRGLAALAIKLHRYLDEVPAGLLEEADRRGFPVIEFPQGVGFDDVLNEVLATLLNRQAALAARSEEVHRALVSVVLEGGDLSDLAAELAAILRGPVLVTTPDGRVVAQAGDADELARILESPAFDRFGRFRVEAPMTGHPTRGTLRGRPDCGRTGRPRPDRHLRLGAHLGRRRPQPGAGGDRGRARRDQGPRRRRRRGQVPGRLSARPAHRTGRRRGRLGRARRLPGLGRRPADGGGGGRTRPRPGARVRFGDAVAAGAGTVRRRLADRIRQRDPGAPVASFNTEVVIMLGAVAQEDMDRLLLDLDRQVAGDRGGGRLSFSLGISRAANDPGELPRAYEQARTAVRIGRRLHGPGARATFDQLGAYRLLALIPDSGELRGYVNDVLGELAADTTEAADLRHTLEVLLDTNGNVAETARRLHFHYNTLRYRIEKLERLVGPFTDNAALRLDLSLALRVRQMRGTPS